MVLGQVVITDAEKRVLLEERNAFAVSRVLFSLSQFALPQLALVDCFKSDYEHKVYVLLQPLHALKHGHCCISVKFRTSQNPDFMMLIYFNLHKWSFESLYADTTVFAR